MRSTFVLDRADRARPYRLAIAVAIAVSLGCVPPAAAQESLRKSDAARRSIAAPSASFLVATHAAATDACSAQPSTLTLRSFDPQAGQHTWVMDWTMPIDSGFVFGTNFFHDRAKGTAFTLPADITRARLESVKVWFGYKHTPLWSDQYDIYYHLEVYDGSSATGPVGAPLHTQRHALIDVEADADLATPSEATPHALYTPVSVGNTFFVSINLGDYDEAAAGRLAIAANERVDQRVAEVWEQQASGAWQNVSDAWFGQSDARGWRLWMEATIAVDQAPTGSPCLQGHSLAAEGVEDYDRLGSALAVDGRYAIVGSTGSSLGTAITQVGHVRMFYFDGSRWVQQARLGTSDQIWGEGVGTAVATSGYYAAAGAFNKGLNDVNDATGAVYMYVRNGASWAEQVKLVPADAAPQDRFGYAVAMRGDRLIAGAPGKRWNAVPDAGSAYVYARTGGPAAPWTEEAQFVLGHAESGANFGQAVALIDDLAIIGAPGQDLEGAADAGMVFLFVRVGSEWSYLASLAADDRTEHAAFGDAVAISGSYAVVGAPGAEAAYVFRRDGSAWTQVAKLTASDATDQWTYHAFGTSVAIDGETIVVGAPGAGRAYVYTLHGGTWSERFKLTASGETASLGRRVAISGTHILLAAPDYDASAWDPDQGLVLAYDLAGTSVSSESMPDAFPRAVALGAPYPNPFNPYTTVTLSVDRTQPVSVLVYDVAGRVVARLHEGILPAGTEHRFTFDASALPSGIYLIRAAGETVHHVRRVALVR